MTIVDDKEEPLREGVEVFAVTIAAADSSSVIGDPDTTLVAIDDSDLDGEFTSIYMLHLHPIVPSVFTFPLAVVYYVL